MSRRLDLNLRLAIPLFSLVISCLFPLTIDKALAAPTLDCTISSGSLCRATFPASGSRENWVVPAGITSITVDVQGAAGADGASPGGKGSRMQATLTVTPSSTLVVSVGLKGSQGNLATNTSYSSGIQLRVAVVVVKAHVASMVIMLHMQATPELMQRPLALVQLVHLQQVGFMAQLVLKVMEEIQPPQMARVLVVDGLATEELVALQINSGVVIQVEVQFLHQMFLEPVGERVALVDLVVVAPDMVAQAVAVVDTQAVAVVAEVVIGAQVVVVVHF